MSQGYLLPLTHVNAMSVTNTERGITHKNLLLALESGYIYTLPKNLLDPRRNFHHTAELEEEGLVPYVPELPLHPMTYVNYNKTGMFPDALALIRKILVYFITHLPRKEIER